MYAIRSYYVTVVVKGTTTGTVTDMDGAYSLPNVEDSDILLFSFVGMKSQEIPVAGKTSIDILMEEETIGIGEVVAIGYGTVKKSDLTGAVSSVNADALKTRVGATFDQLMTGVITSYSIHYTKLYEEIGAALASGMALGIY